MSDLRLILKHLQPASQPLKFREFVRAAWPLIEPARPYRDNWCMGAVCEHLQAVTDGQIKKLIINIPPGMAKSTLVSVMWAPYEWTFRPWLRWMFASHRMQLAFRDAGRRRLVMSSTWFKETFADSFTLSSEQLKYITNSAQGSMFSSSVDSQDVLGFRAHRLCLDDPHDPQGAISEVQRATTTEWLGLTWPTRKDDTPESAEVLVMQRLHELDATGLYLKQGGFVHLKLPMEHKGKTFSSSDKRAVIGELIDENVQSREYVDDKKKRLGPWGEAAQYDQEPAPLGGGVFKSAWFGKWAKSDTQPGSIKAGIYGAIDPWNTFRFAVMDPAITEKTIGEKKNSDPDYTVIYACMAFATPQGALLCIMDMVRERLEGPDIVARLKAMHKHWRFSIIGIETVAFQLALFQYAQREGLPVREICSRKDPEAVYTIDRDKMGRAVGATPFTASGRCYVPEYAPWTSDFFAEVCTFPNAAHDDTVDALAYACAIAEKYKDNPGFAGVPDEPKPRAVFSDHRRPGDGPADMYDSWGAGAPP